MNELIKAMAEVNDLNRTHGVVQRGGKKYTEVFVRVEAFRKAFGTDLGIDTEIMHDDGQRVVVKARIMKGAITVGSGIAEEIRGSSNVNRTSAIENAETSAIGRALASLGLHGGTYASLNEIVAVARKEQAMQQPAQPAPQPQAQPAPEESEGRKRAVAWCQGQWEVLKMIKNLDDLMKWDEANTRLLDRLNEEHPDLYEKLYNAFNKRKAML